MKSFAVAFVVLVGSAQVQATERRFQVDELPSLEYAEYDVRQYYQEAHQELCRLLQQYPDELADEPRWPFIVRRAAQLEYEALIRKCGLEVANEEIRRRQGREAKAVLKLLLEVLDEQ